MIDFLYWHQQQQHLESTWSTPWWSHRCNDFDIVAAKNVSRSPRTVLPHTRSHTDTHGHTLFGAVTASQGRRPVSVRQPSANKALPGFTGRSGDVPETCDEFMEVEPPPGLLSLSLSRARHLFRPFRCCSASAKVGPLRRPCVGRQPSPTPSASLQKARASHSLLSKLHTKYNTIFYFAKILAKVTLCFYLYSNNCKSN